MVIFSEQMPPNWSCDREIVLRLGLKTAYWSDFNGENALFLRENHSAYVRYDETTGSHHIASSPPERLKWLNYCAKIAFHHVNLSNLPIVLLFIKNQWRTHHFDRVCERSPRYFFFFFCFFFAASSFACIGKDNLKMGTRFTEHQCVYVLCCAVCVSVSKASFSLLFSYDVDDDDDSGTHCP